MYEFLGKSDYIEHEDLIGLDLDWFALDEKGQIAHFATAGRGPVPKYMLKKNIYRLHQFFHKKAEKISEVLESRDWFKYENVNTKDKEIKSRYLSSFMEIASRDLYSFNCSGRHDAPKLYFRIVIPKTPLLVNDLPDDIKIIMENIALENVDFSNSIELLPNQIGEHVM